MQRDKIISLLRPRKIHNAGPDAEKYPSIEVSEEVRLVDRIVEDSVMKSPESTKNSSTPIHPKLKKAIAALSSIDCVWGRLEFLR